MHPARVQHSAGKDSRSYREGSPLAKRDGNRSVSKTRVAFAAAAALALAGIYWWLWHSGALKALGDEQALRDNIQRLGIWGPLGIIVLMAGAIVLSPIPSGPIAPVAGAAFEIRHRGA